jgi:hypothetical protein
MWPGHIQQVGRLLGSQLRINRRDGDSTPLGKPVEEIDEQPEASAGTVTLVSGAPGTHRATRPDGVGWSRK